MNIQLAPNVHALEPNLLRLGDSGQAVQNLQQVLEGLGLYTKSIDGLFGVYTELAIRQLQKQFALQQTGLFNTATWYALTFWTGPSDFAPTTEAAPAATVSVSTKVPTLASGCV